tara:strand:- start:337 stop:1017 length:681 start_codon:yes stop_codon:yes gene_type:complete
MVAVVVINSGDCDGNPVVTVHDPCPSGDGGNGSDAGFSTGDVKLTFKNTPESGWVMCDDGSIGNAASAATNRADADTEALYTLFWNSVSDTYAPVTGGRGADAAADFAANKPLTLTKMLGRTVGISGAGASLTTRSLGQTVGAESHTLTKTELPADKLLNGVGDDGANHCFVYGITSSGAPGAAIGSVGLTNTTPPPYQGYTEPMGSGSSHNNMQPTAFLNAMIKL